MCLVAQLCPSLYNPMDCSPPGSSVHGDSPGKKTGVGCHVLQQGIFLTPGFFTAEHRGGPLKGRSLSLLPGILGNKNYRVAILRP